MDQSLLSQQFFATVQDCRRIYVDKSVEAVVYRSDLDAVQRDEFLDEVEIRFNRLLIKVFVEVAWSDCVWSEGEGDLAIQLVEDLMRTRVKPSKALALLEQLQEINKEESWQSVLEPFTMLEELDGSRADLEVGLIRLANIVAKIDGNVTDETVGQLKNLKWQLHQFLAAPPELETCQESTWENNEQAQEIREAIHDAIAAQVSTQSVSQQTSSEAQTKSTQTKPQQSDAQSQPQELSAQERAERLDSALAELDGLVGIDSIKNEIAGLVNFLKVQSARKAAGLPENSISLHMVFEGNPGTGKTTVGRILGRIFGAMGVLEKGHLVETDRGGLVAEFVGQTAAKTNKIIDEALDGVLFIDEAYALVNDAKDSFGAEAMQILLKRAEDDRARLIVVLAGYSDEMKQLLKTNPGLSSRFSRTFHFPDYANDDLIHIFELMAQKGHYQVSEEVREALRAVFESAISQKDKHFGNGRLVRNVFEKAIRNLADRVVNNTDLTPEVLTTIEPADISLQTS